MSFCFAEERELLELECKRVSEAQVFIELLELECKRVSEAQVFILH
jgi:hypothetical protein